MKKLITICLVLTFIIVSLVPAQASKSKQLELYKKLQHKTNLYLEADRKYCDAAYTVIESLTSAIEYLQNENYEEADNEVYKAQNGLTRLQYFKDRKDHLRSEIAELNYDIRNAKYKHK